MCSRYAFVPDERAWTDFRSVLGALADDLLALPARPRLAPTDSVPIVVQQPGGPPQVVHARWGFVPAWWNKPQLPTLCFNARSEEAALKPMWRDAIRRTRCLIPATSWVEWQKAHGVKIPHRLMPHAGRGFMFAGLWSLWPRGKNAAGPESGPEVLPTCVILTKSAAPGIARIHDRMPVVLAPEAWHDWLDPARTEPAAALALIERHAVGGVAATTIDRH